MKITKISVLVAAVVFTCAALYSQNSNQLKKISEDNKISSKSELRNINSSKKEAAKPMEMVVLFQEEELKGGDGGFFQVLPEGVNPADLIEGNEFSVGFNYMLKPPYESNVYVRVSGKTATISAKPGLYIKDLKLRLYESRPPMAPSFYAVSAERKIINAVNAGTIDKPVAQITIEMDMSVVDKKWKEMVDSNSVLVISADGKVSLAKEGNLKAK